MASIIPRKKVLIPRFTEESIPKLRTAETGMKKISFIKNPAPANRIDSMFLSDMLQNGIPKVCSFFPRNGIFSEHFLHCWTVWNGIPRVFCSAEWFRTKFRKFVSIFVPWYRILSILLLCGTVGNGIPRVFCSAEQPEFRWNKSSAE